jgi:hypothetical protein
LKKGFMLKFETRKDKVVYGTLALVKKDSVRINDHWFAINIIKTVYVRDNHYQFDSKTFRLTTAGLALATAGMTLAG